MAEMREKVNLFGVDSETWGQRLMNAIDGHKHPVGILGYRINDVLEILRKKLSNEEFEITVRCFGINSGNQKETQKAVAASLGINKGFNAKCHKIVEKIKRHCKSELTALVPTLDEISNEIEALRKENENLRKGDKETAKLQHSLEKCQAEAKRLKQYASYQKSKIDKVEAENRLLVKQRNAARDAAREASQREVHAITRANAVKNAFDEALNAYTEAGTEAAKLALSNAMTNAELAFKDLRLSKEALDALSRAKISDVGTLLKMTPHTLRGLGVSIDIVNEIREKLKDKGLALRA